MRTLLLRANTSTIAIVDDFPHRCRRQRAGLPLPHRAPVRVPGALHRVFFIGILISAFLAYILYWNSYQCSSTPITVALPLLFTGCTSAHLLPLPLLFRCSVLDGCPAPCSHGKCTHCAPSRKLWLIHVYLRLP